MGTADTLHQGCTAGDLIVRAIRRGGDRVAFVLEDRSIAYRAFGALLSGLVQVLEARGLRPGAEVAAETLIALLREAKGTVQAPKSIDFAESLPVTGLGKPDNKALRARYWGGTTRAVN